ncbi:MAG TPA: hypothetical protein VGD14_22090, partial [bacterium]
SSSDVFLHPKQRTVLSRFPYQIVSHRTKIALLIHTRIIRFELLQIVASLSRVNLEPGTLER